MSEWKVKRIGDMTDIFSGYAFKSSEFDNNGNIPVIKIGNINSLDVDIYNNISYVDEETYKKIDEKYIVKYGDVLISLTGSNINQPNSIVGRVGRYREQTVSVLNQRAGKLVAFEGFSKDFIYHLFSLKSMTY